MADNCSNRSGQLFQSHEARGVDRALLRGLALPVKAVLKADVHQHQPPLPPLAGRPPIVAVAAVTVAMPETKKGGN